VGQTVTITDVVSNAALHGMKEDAKDEANEHYVDKTAAEHGRFRVTRDSRISIV
jgi:hypothetical protein